MNKKSAFSLLELIFAIVIIGVIASVAIPKFMDTKSDAEAATVKQDINTIVTSTRSYVMVGNEIENFAKILTLNENVWDESIAKTLKLKDDIECLSITVNDNQLVLTVKETSENTLCGKLISLGVKSSSYELN